MGTSRGDFYKYPRTPHISGSTGTSDDRHLGPSDSQLLIADDSLIVEEKLDGTNVGLHFSGDQMILQCRGHEITSGMHPQYDLFKQWVTTKRNVFLEMLGNRFIIYGEWMYAKHSILYRQLPHFFFEFDILDKQDQVFLSLDRRLQLLEGTGIQTVPVLHRGATTQEELMAMITESQFDSVFENPMTGRPDSLMEGLYLRTESNGIVSARAKRVRPEFTEKVKQSSHWQYEKMIPNRLRENVDIWS